MTLREQLLAAIEEARRREAAILACARVSWLDLQKTCS